MIDATLARKMSREDIRSFEKVSTSSDFLDRGTDQAKLICTEDFFAV
jgi:hypothetical protein